METRCIGEALFAGRAGRAGGDALCATRYAEGVDGRLCLLDVMDVMDVPEVMRCVLHRMPEGVEGRLCLLDVMDMPEVMRCVLHRMPAAVEGNGGLRLLERVGGAGPTNKQQAATP